MEIKKLKSTDGDNGEAPMRYGPAMENGQRSAGGSQRDGSPANTDRDKALQRSANCNAIDRECIGGRAMATVYENKRITEVAHTLLKSSGYAAIRRVNCVYDEGVLVLRGEVPSYYQKQIAQAAVSGLGNVERIVNRIRVVEGIDGQHGARRSGNQRPREGLMSNETKVSSQPSTSSQPPTRPSAASRGEPPRPPFELRIDGSWAPVDVEIEGRMTSEEGAVDSVEGPYDAVLTLDEFSIRLVEAQCGRGDVSVRDGAGRCWAFAPRLIRFESDAFAEGGLRLAEGPDAEGRTDAEGAPQNQGLPRRPR